MQQHSRGQALSVSIAQQAVFADATVAVEFLLGETGWVEAWRDWTASSTLILVPAHFGHEVANALLKGARIGGIGTIAAPERLFRVGLEVADRGYGRPGRRRTAHRVMVDPG